MYRMNLAHVSIPQDIVSRGKVVILIDFFSSCSLPIRNNSMSLFVTLNYKALYFFCVFSLLTFSSSHTVLSM